MSSSEAAPNAQFCRVLLSLRTSSGLAFLAAREKTANFRRVAVLGRRKRWFVLHAVYIHTARKKRDSTTTRHQHKHLLLWACRDSTSRALSADFATFLWRPTTTTTINFLVVALGGRLWVCVCWSTTPTHPLGRHSPAQPSPASCTVTLINIASRVSSIHARPASSGGFCLETG